MDRIVVVDEPPGGAGSGVVSATDYLLSGVFSSNVALEVQNHCTSSGTFSARAYVDRFAWARGHGIAGASRPIAQAKVARGPLGILYTPSLLRCPSQPETLRHVEALAARRDVPVRWMSAGEIDAVDEVGALFIRDDTCASNHTLAFASRARARGIPVVDAPESIVACSDKATQSEIFAAWGIPTPRTRLLHTGNVAEVVASLGYPFVLKQVDGSWSREVWRIDGPDDLDQRLPPLLARGLFAVAQEWQPTAFDWRVGVLGGQLLFAARYHAVPGHWQVAQWDGDTVTGSGRTEPVALRELPSAVGELARAAAVPFGDGFFGVDLKETTSGLLVIEVNDCVDLDLGCEDGAEGDPIYERLLDALGYG